MYQISLNTDLRGLVVTGRCYYKGVGGSRQGIQDFIDFFKGKI